MFSSHQENEPATLTTKTFVILRLPGMQSSLVDINPNSYHLIVFELVNLLLYIYFLSSEYRIFLKDLKSTLPWSVALRFLNLANIHDADSTEIHGA